MSGFWKDFRKGRNEVRAARGLTPLGGEEWVEEEVASGDAQPADVEALQAELQQRDDDLNDAKRLIGELKDYAEQLQERVKDLIINTEQMANVLRLPGVKKYLRMCFHPDQHVGESQEQLERLKEAMQTINAAYAVIDKERHSAED